jgi:hypothetical protein
MEEKKKRKRKFGKWLLALSCIERKWQMLYSFSKCYILSENCKEKKKTFYSLLHACAAMLYLYFMSACLPRHIQNICLVKVPSSMT